MVAPPPRWVLRATAALAEAGGRVRVIAASTPGNLRRELGRLEQAWRATGEEAPRFAYEAPPDHRGLRGVLDAIAGELESRGDLGAIYAARAREMADDAALCEAAGTPGL